MSVAGEPSAEQRAGGEEPSATRPQPSAAREAKCGALGVTSGLRDSLLDNISDGVYYVDRHRRILYWNRSAERITGFSSDEVLGRSCREGLLMHCDDAGTILCNEHCPLLDTIQDGRAREAHLYLHHKDGHRKPVRICAAPIHDDDGEIIGAVETFHDDSALVHSRQRAAHLLNDSMRDPLTGVGNRRLGDTVLAGWLEDYHRFQRAFGVLFIDIDHFKRVNDSYGHAIGDEALRVVARTLADNTRQGDHVVRWGGEEFVALLGDADATTLAATAERFRMLVSRSGLRAGRNPVELSISLGGTLVAPGDDAATITRRADALLYESKFRGRNLCTLDVDPHLDLGSHRSNQPAG